TQTSTSSSMRKQNSAPSTTDNPLLTQQFPIPFTSIRADMVQPAITLLLSQMRERVAEIGDSKTPRSYERVLLALDTMTKPLDFAVGVTRHLEAVATTPELRAAYNAVQGPVSQFYTLIPLDSNLWNAVKT